MKTAFVLSGQPRFTPDFLDLLKQVQGINSGDLFIVLWNTTWSNNEQHAKSKIEKVLPNNWKILDIKIVNEPAPIYPPGTPDLGDPIPENIAWWYTRNYSQFISTKMAFDLIPPNVYDIVTRIRGDASLDRSIDYSKIELDDNLIIASNSTGFPDYKFNDQFFLGKYESMKKFFSFIDEMPKYIPLADPNWINSPHGYWRGEWLNGFFLKCANLKGINGGFNTRLNTYGRSKFTDKHYHHMIAKDPTEE